MKRPLLCAIAMLTSSLTGPVQADTEREYLMRLTQEIDALAPLIDAAEENADKSRRIRFRYDWLRRDLARIREGLLEHATADQAAPLSAVARRLPALIAIAMWLVN